MARPEAKLVRLDLEQQKTEWIFSAFLDELLAAEMRAVPEQGNVLVHLRVFGWSRELCREYVCCFMAIRQFLRESGFQLVIACSDHADQKMKHFWRMMGFVVFGEVESHGRLYAYAVMEA